MMDAALISSVIAAAIGAGTPLILAALGELVTERAGVLNLGTEGMMAVGAVTAFVVAHGTGSPGLALLAGMAAGLAMSLLFGFLALTVLANQVASGLALSIFGEGLSAFVGKAFESSRIDAVPPLRLPWLADIPLLGPALFSHQSIVYLSWLVAAGVVWFLHHSRAGLVLRAVGESPTAAHAIGFPVIPIRYLAVAFGGAMAGAGGAYLSVYYTPVWTEGLVAGRGWIALALVVFATWKPLRVVGGAYLFGGVMMVQLFFQGSGLQIGVPAQLLSSLPYLATIAVLVVISRNPKTIRLNSPMSLGRTFRPDD